MFSLIKIFSWRASSLYHTVIAALALLTENVLIKETPASEVTLYLCTPLHKRIVT
jgi:hypothetical protein